MDIKLVYEKEGINATFALFDPKQPTNPPVMIQLAFTDDQWKVLNILQ